jgi:predicted permease
MNAGYLGIPLIYLLFGERALPFALTYMVVMAVYHFTLGIFILEGSFKEGVLSALKVPLIYGAILGLLLKPFKN